MDQKCKNSEQKIEKIEEMHYILIYFFCLSFTCPTVY
jgi:hypothetical protein